MKKAYIDPNICDRSPFCPAKRVCPTGAITQEVKLFGASTPKVDQNKCIGCGKCAQICPQRAIKMI